MLVVYVLILIFLGIGFSQIISSHRMVTLNWLRLGDLIALPILVIGVIIFLRFGSGSKLFHPIFVILVVSVAGLVFHLILVQLNKRLEQRVVMGVLAGGITVYIFILGLYHGCSVTDLFLTDVISGEGVSNDMAGYVGLDNNWLAVFSPGFFLVSSWLVGGSIMTMLLGHAYLTAGNEMTQQPFARLGVWLLWGILARFVGAVLLGLIPWFLKLDEISEDQPQIWIAMLISVRFLAGLVLPGIMGFMVIQCIRIRANQSATGILYVVSILILIGELTSISVSQTTGLIF